MFYAGIGSRKTPPEILEKMKRIAGYLSSMGYTLRSGGAVGADLAFEDESGEAKEIFLAKEEQPLWTNVFTDLFHPAPERLKEWPRKLMNRNAMQILGRDGNTPVRFVVCWTKDGKASGGTGQAIRIAEYFNIPVFNLKNEGAIEALRKYLKEETR